MHTHIRTPLLVHIGAHIGSRDHRRVYTNDPRYLRKANCLLGMQRESQAEEVYRLALKKDPNNQEAMEGLARARREK